MNHSDSYYLEKLTRQIFEMADEEEINEKWRSIRQTFFDFNIDKVASFRDNNIFGLIRNPNMIRNFGKIKTVVESAREIRKIRDQYGSFEIYLKNLGEKDKVFEDLRKRIHNLDQQLIKKFLSTLGEQDETFFL